MDTLLPYRKNSIRFATSIHPDFGRPRAIQNCHLYPPTDSQYSCIYVNYYCRHECGSLVRTRYWQEVRKRTWPGYDMTTCRSRAIPWSDKYRTRIHESIIKRCTLVSTLSTIPAVSPLFRGAITQYSTTPADLSISAVPNRLAPWRLQIVSADVGPALGLNTNRAAHHFPFGRSVRRQKRYNHFRYN